MAKYCPYCVSRIDSGSSCPYCSYGATYSAKPHHLKPGTLLNNKYLVGRVLGEGGFGITYVGRDLTLDMKIAIKEYYPSAMAQRSNFESNSISVFNWTFSSDFKSGKEQFIHEAQTIAKMDKESAVVTVRDFFEQNNSAYIVMEFVEGDDLRNLIKQSGAPFESGMLLGLLEPVFAALGELHNIGLIHRDISPDNIMIENGRARLIDFGCARESLNDGASSDAVLKHSFSPIEQYTNTNMGPWSDVYAMAATIYYCLTGKLPPKATDRAVKDELIPPTALGASLTNKQEHALLKALSIKCEDRYQSMAEFGKELFVHKNKYKLIAVAACIVAVAAIAAFALFRPGTKVETLKVANTVSETLSASDALTVNETAALEQLSTIIESLVVQPAADSFYYYTSVIENTTDYDFDKIYIYYKFFDENGVIVQSGSDSMDSFDMNASKAFRFYSGGNDVHSVHLRAIFTIGNRSVQTDYIPASISKSESTSEDISSMPSIDIKNRLPETFTYKGYSSEAVYTISSFSPEVYSESSSGTYSAKIHLGGSFDSGEDFEYGYIRYRVLDSSGTVFDSGTVSLDNLKVGDKFNNITTYISDLPPGSYFFELSDYIY